MSLFDKLFGNRPKPGRDDGYFQTLTAYTPAFNSWNGQLYEAELIRSAIDARARHISKLKCEFVGSAKPKLKSKMLLKLSLVSK